MKRIALLGSTGSIGTQTLDVVREHAGEYEAYALTAGHNAELLIAQAREFRPEAVVIADESRYETVREALVDLPIKVWAGAEAICDVARLPEVDVVVTAWWVSPDCAPRWRLSKPAKPSHWPIRRHSLWRANSLRSSR